MKGVLPRKEIEHLFFISYLSDFTTKRQASKQNVHQLQPQSDRSAVDGHRSWSLHHAQDAGNPQLADGHDKPARVFVPERGNDAGKHDDIRGRPRRVLRQYCQLATGVTGEFPTARLPPCTYIDALKSQTNGCNTLEISKM